MTGTRTSDTASDAIERMRAKLEAKTDELEALFTDAAEAEGTYRIEFAKAKLLSKHKTLGDREAEATVQCADLLMDRLRKTAVADAAKESARHLADQLRSKMSVGANLREEMRFAGRGAA